MAATPDSAEYACASLGQRCGALVYESVLLVGVVFFVAALTHTLLPSADGQPWVLRLSLFVGLGAYFTTCWHKSGQTLAMKAWRVQLVGRASPRISWPTALLRYCAAWTLVAPGLILVWALSARGFGAMLLFGAGVLVMLAPALFNRDRRLLHDWIAGTRLVRV